MAELQPDYIYNPATGQNDLPNPTKWKSYTPIGSVPSNNTPVNGLGANSYQASLNKLFGTTLGNKTGFDATASRYAYTDPITGQQAFSGDLGDNEQAMQYFKDNPAAGTETSSFGMDSFGNVAKGLQTLGGLAQAYVGYKNYGLAKDQFDFEKRLAGANYGNASKAYNTNLQNSADVGLALAGNSMTPEQKAAYQTKIAADKVSTKL